MYYLKACPRCRGDMILEQDFYGTYVKCLQCARIIDIDVQHIGKDKLAAYLSNQSDQRAA